MTAPLAALVAAWTKDLDPTIPGRSIVPPNARAFILAATASRRDEPLLAIVPGEREAEDLVDDIGIFLDEVLHLPAWETLPFEHVSPNVVTMAKRIEARHRLGQPGAAVVVASVRAATSASICASS